MLLKFLVNSCKIRSMLEQIVAKLDIYESTGCDKPVLKRVPC